MGKRSWMVIAVLITTGALWIYSPLQADSGTTDKESPTSAKTAPTVYSGALVVSKDLSKLTSYQVKSVKDGDTLTLSDGRQVRLICIDTPERGEPLYKKATQYLRQLVLHRKVYLEFDRTKKDRYGRLLSYIYTAYRGKKLLSVNGQMVARGYASVYPYPPNIKRWKSFTEIQKYARKTRAGMWGLSPRSRDPYYVAGKYRFHRPQCRHSKTLKKRRGKIYKTIGAALDDGLSRGRCCKP